MPPRSRERAVAWYGRSLDEPLDARVRHWPRVRQHPVVHGVSQGLALLGSIPVVIAGAAVGAAIVGRRRGDRRAERHQGARAPRAAAAASWLPYAAGA